MTDPSSKPRVLVIDDEPMLRKAMERVLRYTHDVTEADDGASALAVLEADSDFDVILCDVMMPKMDGIELYRALLAADPALAGRVVFVTGGSLGDELERVAQEHGVTVLEKPVARDTLLEVVNSFRRD